MDKIIIEGGTPLHGDITISGAKNAVLPLMAASLLTSAAFTLQRLPDLADVRMMGQLLSSLGVEINWQLNNDNEATGVTCNASDVTSYRAEYDIVRKMRASVLVLGPLLARFGTAEVSLPGGCAIGTRPVDLHLYALRAMGAEIDLRDGYMFASAPNGLHGAEILFDTVSVGATENALMAATLAKGTTVLYNAACEPEITDLANCLVSMGANISGIGTQQLTITGVAKLGGANHHVIADRIETGSYAIAAAITKGRLRLRHTRADLLTAFLDKLREAGVVVKIDGDNLIIDGQNATIEAVNITTAPHPAFPTDMQAQWMALMTQANGAALIDEAIFENRFMHVPELCRLGANITMQSNTALVKGPSQLRGAEVMATDLRASMSLVLSALAAQGSTTINRVYHIDRGYEHVVRKLQGVGAHISRVT